MKLRLMAATAAFALFAGAASAQTPWTADQETEFRTNVEASAAGGEVIPSADTEGWDVGAAVPEDYQSQPVEGMEGMSYVQDEENFYILDENRSIVHRMAVTEASGAGGETTPGADGEPVSQPTTAN